MNKRFFILIHVCFCLTCLWAQKTTKSFSLSCIDGDYSFEKIVITSDTTIKLPLNIPVSGLSISGNINLHNMNDSYVRITMIDTYNYEHLVYEVYPMVADSMRVQLENIGFETVTLDNVVPKQLVIRMQNSDAMLNKIHYSDKRNDDEWEAQSARIYACQNKEMVEKLNLNLKKNHKLWGAKETSISRMTFEEKKSLLGGKVPMLYGFEYYAGGIFEYPSPNTKSTVSSNSTSSYVSEWDWRNRHGKNWMTPVKDKGTCHSCWAFSAIGTAEAYSNLYFNQLLNLNLSEQELLSCANAGDCSGGYARRAFDYMISHGVVSEDCLPYIGNNSILNYLCDDPEILVRISGYTSVYRNTDDDIKRELFKSPLCIGITPWWHNLEMAGYKTINVGDSIFIKRTGEESWVRIQEYDELIGKTAWLLKNNWGTSWGDRGYGYVVTNLTDFSPVFKITGGIESSLYNDDDIVVSDEDGDGYYFWGIGPKPSHCPSWVPDTPDGDDSDYTKGPMDEYGYLKELDPDLEDIVYIYSDSVCAQRKYTYNHTVVCNGGSLTLRNQNTFYRNATLTIERGGILIIDAAIVENAKINVAEGATVRIINNGQLKICSNEEFVVPLGANLEIVQGEITH